MARRSCRRIPLFDLLPSLPGCACRAALLHRLWTAAASRFAIHQFTRKFTPVNPIESVRRRHNAPDYTYIDDIVQGTLARLEYDGALFDVLISAKRNIQLKDLIAAIEGALGKKAKINRLREQPGDMPLTCADVSSKGAARLPIRRRSSATDYRSSSIGFCATKKKSRTSGLRPVNN